MWVDGIHFNVRLEDDRPCTLVVIGVKADGTKELVALEDGCRESGESWASVPRDLRGRGPRAPVMAVGDGALGFWSALRDVWSETTPQRDWCHKLANVLDKLPKRLRPRAKRALREMMYAPTRAAAEQAIGAFVTEFEAKCPKATACLVEDREASTTRRRSAAARKAYTMPSMRRRTPASDRRWATRSPSSRVATYRSASMPTLQTLTE